MTGRKKLTFIASTAMVDEINQFKPEDLAIADFIRAAIRERIERCKAELQQANDKAELKKLLIREFNKKGGQ